MGGVTTGWVVLLSNAPKISHRRGVSKHERAGEMGQPQAARVRHDQSRFSYPTEQEEWFGWKGFIILSLPRAACRSSCPISEPSPSQGFDGRYGAQLHGGQELRFARHLLRFLNWSERTKRKSLKGEIQNRRVCGGPKSFTMRLTS